MKIQELMSRQPVTATTGTSLDRAMELMELHDIRHLPILTDEELVGVVSDRDLLEATGWLAPRQRDVIGVQAHTLKDLNPARAVSIAPNTPLPEALTILVNARIGCLPVVAEEELVGIVTEMDVLAAFLQAHKLGRVPTDRDLAVREFMVSDPVTISPKASGNEASDLMAGYGIRHLIVAEGGKPLGLLSDRDLRRLRGEGSSECTCVGDVMATRPEVLAPDQSLSRAVTLMSSLRVSALPVLDHGSAVGIVSLVDVLMPCANLLAEV